MIFSKKSLSLDRRPATSLGVCIALLLLIAAPAANAQEGRGGIRTFDKVTVKKVKPADLPQTSKPGSRTAIRTKSDQLPKAATQEELRELAKHLSSRVVQVVTVQTPPKPYRQVPMVYFGHAVWISPPGGAAKPVLVSSLSWLREADEVFVVPPKVALDEDSEATRAKKSWTTRRRSLASLTAGNGDKKWLDEHRDELVPVEREHADKYRNLVTLTGADGALSAPSSGVELFDVEHKALFRLYGFSPYLGDTLVDTTIMPTHPDDAALAFYWQTSFPAILGAPLVSQDGKLVAINTFQHPKKKGVYLAIPTGAIASYLSPDDADNGSKHADEDDAKD